MTTSEKGNRVDRARIRWQQLNPALRILVQATAISLAAAAGVAALSFNAVINVTAASVLVAIIFGAATFLQARQTQRRQHTVELIMNFQATETLVAADAWMAERIASQRPLGRDVTDDELRHVVAILDYYEFLAALALRGFIDARLLGRLRGGTMQRCHAICAEYIAERRGVVGPELYGSFGVLADEYARRSPVEDMPPPAEQAPTPGETEIPRQVPSGRTVNSADPAGEAATETPA